MKTAKYKLIKKFSDNKCAYDYVVRCNDDENTDISLVIMFLPVSKQQLLATDETAGEVFKQWVYGTRFQPQVLHTAEVFV